MKTQTLFRTGSPYGGDSWGEMPVIGPAMASITPGGSPGAPYRAGSGALGWGIMPGPVNLSMWPAAQLPMNAELSDMATAGCGGGCNCAPCSFEARGLTRGAVIDDFTRTVEDIAVEVATPQTLSPLQIAGIAAVVLFLLR